MVWTEKKMNRLAMLATGTLLISCGGNKGAGDSGTTAGPGEDGGCEAEISELVSPNIKEAPDFYYRGVVRVRLTADDNTAAISLADASGAAIAGTSSFDASTKIVSFTPTDFLAPETDYVASLVYCSGDDTIPFRTSNLGGTPEWAPADLIGGTYVVDLGSAVFVQPANIGSLLQGALSQNILLGVLDATDTTLNMMGAISKDGSTEQDFCNPSIAFPEAADFTEAPYFQIGPQDTLLEVAGYSVTISQLQISGDFSAGGEFFGGGVLMGEIDARDLVDILGELGAGESAAEVCDFIEAIGVTCETCTSDGQEYCLTIEVTDIVAAENPGQVLELVEDCDPANCEGGCD
jgi:hypothetical protein